MYPITRRQQLKRDRTITLTVAATAALVGLTLLLLLSPLMQLTHLDPWLIVAVSFGLMGAAGLTAVFAPDPNDPLL